MPLPMTREMIKMYALLHPRFRPTTAVSGAICSLSESLSDCTLPVRLDLLEQGDCARTLP